MLVIKNINKKFGGLQAVNNVSITVEEGSITVSAHTLYDIIRKLPDGNEVEFISNDELMEVTPTNIRIRKMELDINKRMALKKKEKDIK